MSTVAQDPATANTRKPRVYCADDNPLVTEALKRYIERSPDFAWMGCSEDADTLCRDVQTRGCPEIVLLDVDMPGSDPFEAIGVLQACCGHTRVLMYSGMVRRDLIDRAVQAGAWGYVSKSDGEAALFEAMRRVVQGEFGFSPEAQAVYSG
jgi:DNA-binding NarL/FixJ family response regulator